MKNEKKKNEKELCRNGKDLAEWDNQVIGKRREWIWWLWEGTARRVITEKRISRRKGGGSVKKNAVKKRNACRSS